MTTHRLSFTSDWKRAAACPAAWHAERVAKVWTPAPKECYATGSLFHAALLTPERVPAVYAEYPEFLTLAKAGKTGQKGEPNAAARQCLEDAAYVRQLPEVDAYLTNARCEVEVLWELDGIPWVSHIDWITEPGDAGCAILDVKTAADMDGPWKWVEAQECKRPWHEALLYWWQLAVYRRAIAPEPVGAVGILAVESTEDVPAVRLLVLHEEQHPILDTYAAKVEASMRSEWTSPLTGRNTPSFAAMLAEQDSNRLPRCGLARCGWCRRTEPSILRYHYLPQAAGL